MHNILKATVLQLYYLKYRGFIFDRQFILDFVVVPVSRDCVKIQVNPGVHLLLYTNCAFMLWLRAAVKF